MYQEYGQLRAEAARESFNYAEEEAKQLTSPLEPVAITVPSLVEMVLSIIETYLAGRRVAWTPPLRLYLAFSIVFFLLVAWFASSGILREPGADLAFDAAVQARFLSDELPTLMFLLLPVFALLMKIVYRERLYFDHLIFSLHLHCAAYAALAIMLPLEVVATRHILLLLVQVVVFVSFLAYFMVAVHRVYRSGWLAAILRSTMVLTVYVILVSVAIEFTSELAIIRD